MMRTLLFYKIKLDKNNQLNLFQNSSTTLKDKVKQFIKNDNTDEFLYTNESVVFQIEDIGYNFIFGSYGKVENLSTKSMTRGRLKQNMQITDLQSLKELVENYTYFYFDLDTEECVILSNPDCGGFKSEFSKFLLHHFRASSIYENIQVLNRIDENINESIGKSNHFANISYTYASDKLPENEFLNFRQLSGLKKEQIRTATVQLYLEPGLDYSKNAHNLSNTSNYIDTFSSFKIDTQNETINVIDKILSKKISIIIDENDIDNLKKIKEILKDNLINH